MSHTPTSAPTTSLIQSGSPTIFVSDLKQAVDFYVGVLGLKLLYAAGDHFAMVDAGGCQIGLHPPGRHTPMPGTHGSIQLGLTVSQPIETVFAELRKRGVNFLGPVVDDSAVKLAFFHDPDGNDLYLCEVKH